MVMQRQHMGIMDQSPGCVVFSQLKGFPCDDQDDQDHRIDTEHFLAAASEIVDIIRKFSLQLY